MLRNGASGHRGVSGHGTMFGQMMTATLADEILTDAPGGVRALFCIGANPANALPDQRYAIEALSALDLLVTSEPVWSETARLADIVFAVKQPFERPDHTQFLEGLGLEIPFAQYTPALVPPPAGSDVVDDWMVYYALAQRLGLQLGLGVPVDMERTPDSDDLLELLTTGATVPLDTVRACPAGAVFDRPAPTILPAREGRDARLALAPDDVLAELDACRDGLSGRPDMAATHLLVARRERETMNSFGRDLAVTRRRFPTNPAWMHPDDLAALSLTDGARVRISVDHDSIVAEVRGDASVRRGVVSMSHGWGGLMTDDAAQEGASTTRLVARDRAVQAINAMPRLSAIPVIVSPL